MYWKFSIPQRLEVGKEFAEFPVKRCFIVDVILCIVLLIVKLLRALDKFILLFR